jgi:hypothetical protein
MKRRFGVGRIIGKYFRKFVWWGTFGAQTIETEYNLRRSDTIS